MSWDLYVQDWGNFNSLSEIPDDYEPTVIGQRNALIEKILEIEAHIDFSDPSWGKLENDHFSIEFNMGEDAELSSFVMHVRGSELAIPCIAQILNHLNLRATDGNSFFDNEASMENLKNWLAYKEQILKESQNE